LIAEHGKDIQHAPGQGPPTGYIPSTTKSKVTSSSAEQSLAKSSKPTSTTTEGPRINTIPVNTSSELRTSAAELFTTFTDPQRLTAFTRSPPSIFEGAKPGGKFALFGGGVQGEYVSLKEPTQIVQKWRLSLWPQGHYSTLTLDFDQDDVNGVTNMRASWDKVPVGEDENTKEKWGEYYVRSLKTTFG
jgi:activator of HSP90 ATPase